MAFIPPVSVKTGFNLASNVGNSLLKRAEDNFEVVKRAAKQGGVEALIVKIVDGEPTLTINPKFARYAEIMGLKIG